MTTQAYDPAIVRHVQRDLLIKSGIELSPDFEHALWPTLERPKEKIVTGGVQAGKSTEGAAEMYIELPLVDLDAAKIEPWRYWYIMPSYVTPKTELEYILTWCRSFYGSDSVKDHMSEGSTSMLDIFDGRVIVETRSSQDPETIAARALRGCVVCEAGQQTAAIRTAALERTITYRGWVTYTGTLEDDEAKPRYAWFDQLAQKWRDDASEGIAVSLPTWANLAKFPLGRDEPEIIDRAARLDAHTFNRRFAGIPSGVQYPVYGELLTGDWGYDGTKKWVRRHGAGGYDFGTTPGHPSTLVVVLVDEDDIACVWDAWEDFGGDAKRNELKRQTMSHDHGIPLSRWGFDPMLKAEARLVGATAMEEANSRRLPRVSNVKARHNDGRLLYNLENPMVRRLFEQMKRVHYQKRSSPTKGEYSEYHRDDDDLAAALENAITVIDRAPPAPILAGRREKARGQPVPPWSWKNA